VNAEDYAVMAETFSTPYHGRIGKALAALRNSGCSGNVVDVYVLQADTSGTFKTANRLLKEALAAHLDGKGMLTDFVCIKDAGQVFLDMNINVTTSRFDSAGSREVYEKVSRAVSDFFSANMRSIGQSLVAVDITRALNSVQGVVSVSVNFASNQQNLSLTNDMVMVDFWKIIRPGNVNINVEST
jgi:copper chaperone CopZ